tara:strand:- start:1641 stop:2015 length:375 start_codon:yes stop_codon:yes gene_type:complete
MSNQLTLPAAFDCQLSALEKRCREKREYNGLLVWTPIFRRILERLRSRDKSVQLQLMQLEHEIVSNPAAAFARLEKIKTLLGVVCFGLLLSVTFLNDDSFVRRGSRAERGGSSVSRLARREFTV